MQSHTFTRSRGVPIYMNGSVSHQRLYDRLSEPSTSRQLPRSISLAPTGHRGGSSRRDRDQVDIHDADFAPNESIVLYETLQALEMAKASGKIRHIGLTGYPLAKLVQLVDCCTTKIDFVMTYCKGTLNNNSLGQFTAWFQTRNIAVINSGALCWGLLTEKGPPPWHPASDEIREACLAATTYCSSKNISISKLALDYALNFPNIVCCLVGMDSVQQVLDNLELANFSRITDVEQRIFGSIRECWMGRSGCRSVLEEIEKTRIDCSCNTSTFFCRKSGEYIERVFSIFIEFELRTKNASQTSSIMM
ncbi:unnamed protein product [Caenorhabditis nigoni]